MGNELSKRNPERINSCPWDGESVSISLCCVYVQYLLDLGLRRVDLKEP